MRQSETSHTPFCGVLYNDNWKPSVATEKHYSYPRPQQAHPGVRDREPLHPTPCSLLWFYPLSWTDMKGVTPGNTRNSHFFSTSFFTHPLHLKMYSTPFEALQFQIYCSIRSTEAEKVFSHSCMKTRRKTWQHPNWNGTYRGRFTEIFWRTKLSIFHWFWYAITIELLYICKKISIANTHYQQTLNLSVDL